MKLSLHPCRKLKLNEHPQPPLIKNELEGFSTSGVGKPAVHGAVYIRCKQHYKSIQLKCTCGAKERIDWKGGR